MDFKEFQKKKKELEEKINDQLHDFVNQIDAHIRITRVEITGALREGIVKDHPTGIHLHMRI
jgi:hypothetical protein